MTTQDQNIADLQTKVGQLILLTGSKQAALDAAVLSATQAALTAVAAANSAATSVGTPNSTILAVDAITGFSHIPTCAGAPVGIPQGGPTGGVAILYDLANSKLWIYTGNAWKSCVMS